MKDPWKALPWVASVSLHATAFFFLAGLLMNVPAPERRDGGLELTLSLEPGGPRGAKAPAREAASVARPVARAVGATVPARPVAGVSKKEESRTAERDGAAAQPVPGQEDQATGWEQSWAADETGGTRAAFDGGGGQIGWDSAARKLLRRKDPKFPAVLSALGQEVECEARITVAPSGGVTRVEITRSSGYTEIDAGVEAALRDYLFSRADGAAATVGTVRFRFRLEKTD